MNKFLLAITSIAALCLLNQTAKAQTDSTHYDLGRIRLNKQFTQAITVKGADLERSPFTNLADALNVWFYGVNTNANSTVYVIDGVMVNDVNAYSIYDIEEASLIQDAVVQLNGAFQHTQLVSITTRKHLAEKSGITAAAQANLVKISYKTANSSDNSHSSTGIYQQYYLSAFKNTQTSHMGISANYQHDVVPGIRYNSAPGQSTSSSGDPKFGLGKFYAYADHILFTGTVAGVKLNYATQKGDGAGYIANSNGVQQYLYAAKQNLFNAEAYVDSKIAGGFTNYLSFTYSNSALDNNSDVSINISGTDSRIISAYHNNNRQYYLKDNLGYKATLGQFTIQPSVNLTYRRPVSVDSAKAFISNGGGAYSQTSQQKASQLTLTPSVDVTYKNIFNIQGGFTQLLSTKISFTNPTIKSKDKALPFVTGGVNSANLFNGFTVSAYGSYSRSTTTIDGVTQLISTLRGDNANTNLYPQPFITPYNVLSDKTYNSFSYGVKLALPNDKVTLSYRYEKRDFEIPVLYYDSYGNTYYTNTGLKYNSHRIELAAKLIKTDKIRWTGNLNASHMKADYAPINGVQGIYQDSNNLWTGGWANRVDYNKFFAGADLLYMFGAITPSGTSYAGEHNKAFSLQNVFVGYTFNTLGLKNMQAYVNARNLAHTVNSSITDDRYFFGAGIKAAF